MSSTRTTVSAGVLALGLLCGSVCATQYLAGVFTHSPQLGPRLVYRDWQLYSPLAWLAWRRRWVDRLPMPFRKAQGLFLAATALGLGVALALRSDRKPKSSGVFGTARWATERELARAGLLDSGGVVLAQTADARFSAEGMPVRWQQREEGSLIRHGGPEHVLVFGPTRSGKGVGPVLSTLLCTTTSVVVYDPKRENWETTASWRSKFSRCLLFDPSSLSSLRFNPLLEVRPYPFDVRDAQNLSECVVSRGAGQEELDHWTRTGRSFLTAVILHVLYAEPDKSLAGVLEFLSRRPLDETLKIMMTTPHLQPRLQKGPLVDTMPVPVGPHPAVEGGARLMASRAPNERSGVLSTAMSFLEIYRDPVLARNTSTSDFTTSDLVCADCPVSLYLAVPPSDSERVKPLVRTLLNFFGRRFTEHLTEVHTPAGPKPRKHPLLYLLDEFPELGTMPHFEQSISYQAGYGMKYLLIAQSLSQIEKAYGRDNAVLDNCQVRLTYGANDERTAARISSQMGTRTAVVESQGLSHKPGAFGLQSTSTNYSERGVPLMTPGEVMALPPTDAIVMAGGVQPYRAKKVMFYQDPRFLGRAWNRQTGENAAPKTLEAMRRQLPPAPPRSHWLELEPVVPRAPSWRPADSQRNKPVASRLRSRRQPGNAAPATQHDAQLSERAELEALQLLEQPT